VATINDSKLKRLFTHLAPGAPLTSRELAALGISADLAVHYVRAGWLTRLARGVYCRPNDPPALHSSLVLLQGQIEALHVGGKSALDWHGIRHYVEFRPRTRLYGWTSAELPSWFSARFSAEYHRKRIFKEQPTRLLHVRPFERRDDAPLVSAPERALLELLSEVGVRQGLEEAGQLVEMTYTFRVEVLQELLTRCTSIKTVRLCLKLGHELSLPWAAKLSRARLPTGSNRPWVSGSAGALLVLKP
jgi:hypothetical protein